MSRKIVIIIKIITIIVLIVCLSLLHVSSERTYDVGEVQNEIPNSENQSNNIQKGGTNVN